MGDAVIIDLKLGLRALLHYYSSTSLFSSFINSRYCGLIHHVGLVKNGVPAAILNDQVPV